MTPAKDIQLYAEPANTVGDKIARRICPEVAGGTNFWPPSFSRATGLLYVPTHEGCSQVTPDATAHVKGKFFGGAIGDGGRVFGGLVALDPGFGRDPQARRFALRELRRRAVDRGRHRGDGADRRHRARL